MITSQRIKADTRVVEGLGVKGARIDIGLAAAVARIADGDYELNPGFNELLVDLRYDIGCYRVGIVTIVGFRPLGIGNNAE